MIRNQREYAITRTEVDRFQKALDEMIARSPKGLHPRLRKAQEEALRSQKDELEAELRAFDALPGKGKLGIGSVSELPDALIQARIAAGLTQKQLAERLGLKEQQVQRYEQTRYASASLDRIRRVTEALGVELRGHLLLAP